MGGNPRFLSATTHLGNLVAHSCDRPVYSAKGTPVINEHTRLIERHLVGSPRLHFPIREDFRLIIREVYESLQVNKRSEQPFKRVRYPQSKGEFKANQLQQRITWLVDALNHTREEAQELATLELENFFNPEDVDPQDPLGSLSQVGFKLYYKKLTTKILMFNFGMFSYWTEWTRKQTQINQPHGRQSKQNMLNTILDSG